MIKVKRRKDNFDRPPIGNHRQDSRHHKYVSTFQVRFMKTWWRELIVIWRSHHYLASEKGGGSLVRVAVILTSLVRQSSVGTANSLTALLLLHAMEPNPCSSFVWIVKAQLWMCQSKRTNITWQILQNIINRFLIARLARSDPRNQFVVGNFFVLFAPILEYFVILLSISSSFSFRQV